MAKVKVYSMGTPWGGTRVIATTTKALAAEAMGCSLYAFSQYGGETAQQEAVDAALANPGQLLMKRSFGKPYEPCEQYDLGDPRRRVA